MKHQRCKEKEWKLIRFDKATKMQTEEDIWREKTKDRTKKSEKWRQSTLQTQKRE